jgi:hypothetical protein
VAGGGLVLGVPGGGGLSAGIPGGGDGDNGRPGGGGGIRAGEVGATEQQQAPVSKTKRHTLIPAFKEIVAQRRPSTPTA